MKQKDFELIAAALSAAKYRYDDQTADSVAQWECVCHMLADALATTNPRFDRARFLEACGVTGADDSHAERKIAKRRGQS